MRQITDQNEEEFSKDKALQKWWKQVRSDKRFHQMLDAVNRRLKKGRPLIEELGIGGAYGYKQGAEEFQKILENLPETIEEIEEKEEMTLTTEPDFYEDATN